MTIERRAQLRQEITNALRTLSILDLVAEHMAADPDLEELQAVHTLLTHQLDRVDKLLLAMSTDRLADERNGTATD